MVLRHLAGAGRVEEALRSTATPSRRLEEALERPMDTNDGSRSVSAKNAQMVAGGGKVGAAFLISLLVSDDQSAWIVGKSCPRVPLYPPRSAVQDSVSSKAVPGSVLKEELQSNR